MIGIGGTGARIIESVIHLCAAGFGPDNLAVFIIDPDEGNGNLSRTKTLISLYQQCQQAYQPTQKIESRLFKTTIKTPTPLVWKIFEEKDVTLANYINLKILPTELSTLASILFTKQELETPLNEGFRGHPSIGAVVMANPDENKEPWSIIWDEINDKKLHDVRIFLAGSVFGGTGAAGVPTFGSLDLIKFNPKAKIADNKSRILLGGALVLPYFSFEKKDEEEKSMFVTNADFPIATKAALNYYYTKSLGFDQLYLIGDSLNQRVGKFSPGSHSQENQPHYIEVVTALAANDFFAQPSIEGDPEKLYFIACRDDENVTWKSLPVSRNVSEITNRLTELKSKLVSMAVFSYSFCTYGQAILKEEHSSIKNAWYRDNFKFNDNNPSDQILNPRKSDNKIILENFYNYLNKYFLTWLCLLDDSSHKVELFNRSQFSKDIIEIGKELNLIDFNLKSDNIGYLLKEKSDGRDFGYFIMNCLDETNLKKEKTLSAANRYINIFYKAALLFSSHNYSD